MKSEEGFLNLAGLYWIEQPMSTLGADTINNFIFPAKTADKLGAIMLRDDSVWFIPEPEIKVKVDDVELKDTTLVFVENEVNRSMVHGDLHWFVIKRGMKYGIRLKDYNHPALADFNHIDNYPIDELWNVEAEWQAYDPPRTVLLHNQAGMDINYEVKGVLKFRLNDENYSLEPIETGEEQLFVMLYDETSGRETYGSGRYLYVDRPVNNRTIIDFNKAFNPPCVYTEFATCLFPHEANRLPISIEVGEKFSGLH